MPDLESVLQEVRKGIGAIVNSEGKPIKNEEVEGAIVTHQAKVEIGNLIWNAP